MLLKEFKFLLQAQDSSQVVEEKVLSSGQLNSASFKSRGGKQELEDKRRSGRKSRSENQQQRRFNKRSLAGKIEEQNLGRACCGAELTEISTNSSAGFLLRCFARGSQKLVAAASLWSFPLSLAFLFGASLAAEQKQSTRGAHRSARRLRASQDKVEVEVEVEVEGQSESLLVPAEAETESESYCESSSKASCANNDNSNSNNNKAGQHFESTFGELKVSPSSSLLEPCGRKQQPNQLASAVSLQLSSSRGELEKDSYQFIFLDSLSLQLVAIVCALLLLLYLVHFLQRIMTNLLSKILGSATFGSGSSDRRRSLAAGNSQQHLGSQHGAVPIAQSHSSSTLSLPRTSASTTSSTSNSQTTSNHQRRASRSSVHSLSAMLMSALTGSSSASGGANNGRSIIAKNKEDTVIIASSSPTIIQKESTDSGTSTVVSNSAGSGSTTGSVVGQSSPSIAAALAAALETENAELAIVDQSLYESVRSPLASLLGGAGNVLNLASVALAANEPTTTTSAPGSSNTPASLNPSTLIGAQQQQQLPTVCTQQIALEQAQAAAGGACAASGVGSSSQSSSHAPLNATNTMKPSNSASVSSPRKATVSSISAATAKRNEVIKATEMLLNALNQGDYDTYTKLCDPHMTSFEPENLGNLIDNMEYRRFCLDQARQLQFHHLHRQQIISHNQTVQQAAAAAAAAAAAGASVTFAASLSGTPATPTKQAAGLGNSQQANQAQLQQIVSSAAAAAASAALANLNLNANQQQHQKGASSGSSNQGGSTAAAAAAAAGQLNQLTALTASHASHQQQLRQYSIMLNPAVHLLGDEAASIAYTKLSQCINLSSGQMEVEQSEETRVWHKKDGNKWLCVHLHRSLVNSNQPKGSLLSTGPQTSASLARLVANQQQLASLAQVHQFNQQQHQQMHQVPLISLNHSSTGGSSSSTQATSAPSSQSVNSSR